MAQAVDEERVVGRIAEGVTRKMVRDDTEWRGSIGNLLWGLRTSNSSRDRAATPLKTAFVPGPSDWQASHLPDRLAPAYRIARPMRLLRKYVARRARTIRVKRRSGL